MTLRRQKPQHLLPRQRVTMKVSGSRRGKVWSSGTVAMLKAKGGSPDDIPWGKGAKTRSAANRFARPLPKRPQRPSTMTVSRPSPPQRASTAVRSTSTVSRPDQSPAISPTHYPMPNDQEQTTAALPTRTVTNAVPNRQSVDRSPERPVSASDMDSAMTSRLRKSSASLLKMEDSLSVQRASVLNLDANPAAFRSIAEQYALREVEYRKELDTFWNLLQRPSSGDIVDDADSVTFSAEIVSQGDGSSSADSLALRVPKRDPILTVPVLRRGIFSYFLLI